jgi:hypothetical protein
LPSIKVSHYFYKIQSSFTKPLSTEFQPWPLPGETGLPAKQRFSDDVVCWGRSIQADMAWEWLRIYSETSAEGHDLDWNSVAVLNPTFLGTELEVAEIKSRVSNFAKLQDMQN